MNNSPFKNTAYFIITIALLMIAIVCVTSTTALAKNIKASKMNNKAYSHAPDRLLVKFKPGASGTQVDNALNKAKNNNKGKSKKSKDRSFKFMNGLKLVTLPPGRNLQDAINQLKKNPNVLYVEPDYEMHINATPNDPSYSELWGLHNSGQTIWGQAGIADVDINAPEAWNTTTGSSNVVIAVLDSGVNHSHPDLIDNMWVNPNEVANGVDDDGNGYIDDIYGIDAYNNDSNPMDDNKHGSHVAGTISSVGNNSVGVTGVSQSTKIIGCKIGNAAGNIFVSSAVICMDYIYDLKVNKNINIVATNNSWGGGSFSNAMYQAIEKHMDAGILFLAAAGNDGTDNDSIPHYPSNYYLPNVIAVAATDNRDNLASFSDYGRRSVHIGAPGVGIYSTTLGTSYEFLQGTSMATPQVSGLIALLAAEDPSRDWKTLKNLVIAGGKDIASLDTTTAAGRRIRAWDTDGTGSMTCNNQTVTSTIYPVASSSTITLGGSLGLGILNINCDTGAGNLTVTGTGPATVNDIYLLDDGLGFDKVANDGIYSANWSAPAVAGTYTLTFPDSQTTSVTVSSTLKPYRQPQSTTYNYRDLSGLTSYSLANGSYYSTSTPFPIKFGGHAGYSTLYFTSKGFVSFHVPSTDGANIEIPNVGFNSLVAPFWDDLDATNGSFRLGSTSTEYILDWQVPHSNNAGTVQFQIVFTKDSSDVIFNYKDVNFGNASLDAGASASVGVQVTASDGTLYSRDSATLSNNSALLWQLDSGAPTADAGADQDVNGGDSITLSGSGSDADGGDLTYAWLQTAGSSVTLSNANSATASFTAPASSGTLTFQLTVTDDAGRQASDTIDVNVSQGSVEGTIGFTTTSFSVDENIGAASISVARTSSYSGAISINYATIAGGTATSGSDYTTASGTLNWSDGESGNKTFNVSITNDSTLEFLESIKLQLSNVTTGGSISNSIAHIYVTDDDNAVSFSAPEYSTNENDTSITITVKRFGGDSGALSVDYATAAGTATAGSDYTSTSGTLNWADGDSSNKTFNVSIIDNSTFEAAEYLNLQLTNASGTSIDRGDVRLYIYDDDSTLSFTDPEYSISEDGGSITVSVKRTGSSSGTASVDYTTTAVSATAGSDYTTASGTLNWSDGELGSKTFSVSIIDDSDLESSEYLTLQLSNANGAGIGRNDPRLYINDNDSKVSLNAVEYSVSEGDGTAAISVLRTGGSSGAISVDYTTTAVSASAGSDFTSVTNTLSWADGESGAKSFNITIIDDASSEPAEYLQISLSNPVSTTINRDNARLYIYDNDSRTSFKAPEYSLNESDGSVLISVYRAGSSSGAASVNYASTSGTATSGSDFTAISGTLSWADGEIGTKSFTVTVTDDAAIERAEYLNLQLSNASGSSIDRGDIKVYIYDNDSAVSFKAPEYNLSESAGTATISVQRYGNSSGAASVDYTTTGGNATAGSDYTTVSGTLSWADGELGIKTFDVSIIDDSDSEQAEYLDLQLSNASGVSIDRGDIRLYIYDNDSSLSFTYPEYSVNEDTGSLSISVRRAGNSSGAVTVDYATIAGGTATATSDFTSTSGTLSWADGELGNKTFSLSIIDDSDFEGWEYVNLELSNASGASIGRSNIKVYIGNNDSKLWFSSAEYPVTENTGTATITVKRGGSSNGAVSVDYTTVDGSAVAGSDYTSNSGTLSWADGDTAAKTFTIIITDDAIKESAEYLTLQLSNVSGASIAGGNSRRLYIYNDD